MKSHLIDSLLTINHQVSGYYCSWNRCGSVNIFHDYLTSDELTWEALRAWETKECGGRCAQQRNYHLVIDLLITAIQLTNPIALNTLAQIWTQFSSFAVTKHWNWSHRVDHSALTRVGSILLEPDIGIETPGVDNQFHFYQLPLALLPLPLFHPAQTLINITKAHKLDSHLAPIIWLLAPLRKL